MIRREAETGLQVDSATLTLMGLLDRIRRGTYVPTGGDELAAPGRRRTLREAAAGVRQGEDPLLAMRELLDQAGRVDGRQLAAMIGERPEETGDERADALFAGIAEHLAAVHGIACPPWAGEPERFLERFWFVSSEPGYRAIALAQSPVALKRRDDVLTRDTRQPFGQF